MNSKKTKKGTSRRSFLKNGLSIGIGAATTTGIFSSCSKNEKPDSGEKVRVMTTDGKLVEIIEIPQHPWFLACQFHPEFTSTPRDGHPLFTGFIKAAREFQRNKNRKVQYDAAY